MIRNRRRFNVKCKRSDTSQAAFIMMDSICQIKTKLNAPYLKVYSVILYMLHLSILQSCVNTKHGTCNVKVMGSIRRESMN